ncbi:MAG: NAD(P)H-dependent oxidoreductase [Bacteroidetes bacterium]|nr:NAD(P)H-dependent oxidoreductase [Bacteroidota bacterium]
MITIISGSARPGSNTLRVARAISRIIEAKTGLKSEVIDFAPYDIPFYNGQDLNPAQLSPFQQKIADSMGNSGLIFLLSPEYNWFPSAEIINLIHRFGTNSFKQLWDDKVFATCGVSTGRGGRMPAVQLGYVVNKLLNVMNLHSVVSPKMFESQFTTKALNESGESLGNAEYDKGLEQFVDYNLMLWKKMNPELRF